jgi:hypothetical protein
VVDEGEGEDEDEDEACEDANGGKADEADELEDEAEDEVEWREDESGIMALIKCRSDLDKGPRAIAWKASIARMFFNVLGWC